ncbi:hypothetical protein SM124_13290 [Bacillus sp. 31A1R]|uniref:Uncharacterized protein n=1 Tax=Robertmurraya mangrovi TaxID=3098077 RepID=A0ABU5IZZ5_9BACI|nr:hypothetical protein [Bacillus sp. 31A1R]MDZ5472706.1 hypothetical protein [Bacillus sp. 31A1R]
MNIIKDSFIDPYTALDGKVFVDANPQVAVHTKVRILETYSVANLDDNGGSVVYLVSYQFLSPHHLLGAKADTEYYSFHRTYRLSHRQPHCYRCKRDLNEASMEICNKCGWIKCPDDNACGCYKKL